MANGAKDRMREEMGPDFDDIDWKQLDPRQYDPRRIIRDALLDDDTPPVTVRPPGSAASAERQAALTQGKSELAAGEKAPFDNEAT